MAMERQVGVLLPYWRGEMEVMFLPNRKMRSHFFLPHPVEVPHGDTKALTFVFTGIPDLGTSQLQYSFNRAWAIVAITGVMMRSDLAALPATGGFRANLTRVHEGKQLQIAQKETTNPNLLGTGQRPLYVRSVDLFDVGDQLVVDVKSLISPGGGVTSRIEVTAVGVEVK